MCKIIGIIGKNTPCGRENLEKKSRTFLNKKIVEINS